MLGARGCAHLPPAPPRRRHTLTPLAQDETVTVETVFPFDVAVRFVSTKVRCRHPAGPVGVSLRAVGGPPDPPPHARPVRAPGEGLRRRSLPAADGPLKRVPLGAHHRVQRAAAGPVHEPRGSAGVPAGQRYGQTDGRAGCVCECRAWLCARDLGNRDKNQRFGVGLGTMWDAGDGARAGRVPDCSCAVTVAPTQILTGNSSRTGL